MISSVIIIMRILRAGRNGVVGASRTKKKKKKREMSFLWEAVFLWFPNPVSEREEFH